MVQHPFGNGGCFFGRIVGWIHFNVLKVASMYTTVRYCILSIDRVFVMAGGWWLVAGGWENVDDFVIRLEFERYNLT